MDDVDMEGFFGDEEMDVVEEEVVAVSPESPPSVTEEDRRVSYIRDLFDFAGEHKPCLLCAAKAGFYGHHVPSFPKKALKAHLDSIVHKDVRDDAKFRYKTCSNLFFKAEDLASHLKMLEGYAH